MHYTSKHSDIETFSSGAYELKIGAATDMEIVDDEHTYTIDIHSLPGVDYTTLLRPSLSDRLIEGLSSTLGDTRSMKRSWATFVKLRSTPTRLPGH